MKRKRKFRKAQIKLHMSVFIFITVFLFFISLGLAKGEQPNSYKEVIVKSGDSLWIIAKKYCPQDQDIRKSIWEIRRINNLDDANIKPGQVLKIPSN
ncbi:MAG TPA: LysM peptidoglycan-binding domain-containing protein [Clostridia bacterium]|nr:LysM peptidoglycan-binding domain-containing protein [Clostridia bacterium]